jgi:hypothetical protein
MSLYVQNACDGWKQINLEGEDLIPKEQELLEQVELEDEVVPLVVAQDLLQGEVELLEVVGLQVLQLVW